MAVASSESKQLSESDITDIINDPIIQECPYWRGIGRQLNLTDGILQVIAQDCHYQTQECKTKMLLVWLKNKGGTLEELHQAVKRATDLHVGKTRSGRRERKQNRNDTKMEEKKALKAVNRVVYLLEDWRQRNEISWMTREN